VDANVGQMPDAVEKAGVRANTIVIFTSDSGLEFIRPWNGWPAPGAGTASLRWKGAFQPCYRSRARMRSARTTMRLWELARFDGWVSALDRLGRRTRPAT
jgi:hypothetical protein